MGQAAVPKKELTLLLAAALGEEKSEELVTTAARALDLPDDVYTIAEARAIFERIATTDGLVGVVARFAITRGDVDSLRTKVCAHVERVENVGGARRAGNVLDGAPVDLAALLAPVLGTEKAHEAIAS